MNKGSMPCLLEMICITLLFAGIILQLIYPTTREFMENLNYDSKIAGIKYAIIRNELIKDQTKRESGYVGRANPDIIFDSGFDLQIVLLVLIPFLIACAILYSAHIKRS